jgi:hypothetical protein
MKVKSARWVAWSLVALFIILEAAGLTLQSIAGAPYIKEVGLGGLVIVLIIVGAWPVVGALIVSRHPKHPIGWFMWAGLLVGPVDMLAAGYTAYDFYFAPSSLPGVTLTFVWLSFGGFPFSLITASLFFLLFPSGQLPSTGWKKDEPGHLYAGLYNGDVWHTILQITAIPGRNCHSVLKAFGFHSS